VRDYCSPGSPETPDDKASTEICDSPPKLSQYTAYAHDLSSERQWSQSASIVPGRD
jgi:hypothetical protein